MRYTVSTSDYRQACGIISALEASGIRASITGGGVGVGIDNDEALATAQRVVGAFGVKVEQGETYAEQWREALRQEKKGLVE